MTTKRFEDSGSFTATGEDGRSYTIRVTTEIVKAGTTADPDAEHEGRQSFQIDLGGGRAESLTRIVKGEYTSASGAIYRSDDPAAP
jgi:hypothetical protein